MNMKKEFAWAALILSVLLPLIHPTLASGVVTSCSKSPDGGAYAWVQGYITGDNTASQEEGYAKLISLKGAGAYAEFLMWRWVNGQILVVYDQRQSLTYSGQTWDPGAFSWSEIVQMEMVTYDGAQSTNAIIYNGAPNPICVGPQHPLP